MKIIGFRAAKDAGLAQYFTGKPCHVGHVTARNTANRNCMECCRLKALVRNKKAYSENPDYNAKAKQRAKRWRQQNPEKYDQNQRRYREANKERLRTLRDQWAKDNPERAKASRQSRNTRRKTRKKANGGECTPQDIIDLKARQNGKCAACNKRSRKMHIDHIVPVARGGSSHRSNLQLLCRRCNLTKSSKDPIKWAQENGRLL